MSLYIGYKDSAGKVGLSRELESEGGALKEKKRLLVDGGYDSTDPIDADTKSDALTQAKELFATGSFTKTQTRYGV